MSQFNNFLSWEATTRDTIDFKKIYVDMADDLVAGLMLSQIVFWHIPNKAGNQKMRVSRDGYMWIAKSSEDWYEECRITKWQVPRALKILKDKSLIDSKLYKFNGAPTVHIRIIEDAFLSLWAEKTGVSPKSILGNHSNGNEGITKMNMSESPKSLTEITTETTTENKLISQSEEAFIIQFAKTVGKKFDGNMVMPFRGGFAPKSIITVIELLEEYGESLVLEVAEWAASKGMSMNKAVSSIKTALPNWTSEIKERPETPGEPEEKIDYDALVAELEAMNAK